MEKNNLTGESKTKASTKAEPARDKLLSEILSNDGTRVCFICTGNTCRSPMAAAVLNAYGSEYGFYASSAGIVPQVGEKISENAVNALEKDGIESTAENDYKNHKARRADEKYLSQFDKIVCVSVNHELLMIKHFPEMAEKITSFEKEILDPYGQGQYIYDKCLSEIKEEIFSMFHLNK